MPELVIEDNLTRCWRQGHWQDGRRHGEGYYTLKNGNKFFEVRDHGILVGKHRTIRNTWNIGVLLPTWATSEFGLSWIDILLWCPGLSGGHLVGWDKSVMWFKWACRGSAASKPTGCRSVTVVPLFFMYLHLQRLSELVLIWVHATASSDDSE